MLRPRSRRHGMRAARAWLKRPDNAPWRTELSGREQLRLPAAGFIEVAQAKGIKGEDTSLRNEEGVEEPLLQKEVDAQPSSSESVLWTAPFQSVTLGDTMIVPVPEEVLGVEKRLVLKEARVERLNN